MNNLSYISLSISRKGDIVLNISTEEGYKNLVKVNLSDHEALVVTDTIDAMLNKKEKSFHPYSIASSLVREGIAARQAEIKRLEEAAERIQEQLSELKNKES